MVTPVGDLNLRDEFAILSYSSVLSDVAQAMLPVKNVAVLLRGKKEKHGIVGIIKKQDLLSAIGEGRNPIVYRAKEIMKTNILRLRNDTPTAVAIETITKEKPDCVLVLKKSEDETNSSHEFHGYLSPNDFRIMKARS